jgi:hypothetical protein
VEPAVVRDFSDLSETARMVTFDRHPIMQNELLLEVLRA